MVALDWWRRQDTKTKLNFVTGLIWFCIWVPSLLVIWSWIEATIAPEGWKARLLEYLVAAPGPIYVYWVMLLSPAIRDAKNAKTGDGA